METNQAPTWQNLFTQTTIQAVFSTENLSRTCMTLDPCRHLHCCHVADGISPLPLCPYLLSHQKVGNHSPCCCGTPLCSKSPWNQKALKLRESWASSHSPCIYGAQNRRQRAGSQHEALHMAKDGCSGSWDPCGMKGALPREKEEAERAKGPFPGNHTILLPPGHRGCPPPPPRCFRLQPPSQPMPGIPWMRWCLQYSGYSGEWGGGMWSLVAPH